jgi:aminoglycoside phosphotransferase (APT) family kinase protein
VLPRHDDPVISLEQAGALIEAQVADLRPAHLRHFGRGWDHEVFLVNEAWVFRFPRNELAAAALETEIALLPWLSARLPLAIPVPVWIGRVEETGWRFAGHACIAGATACDADLDEEARARLAAPLGRFVRALHAVPPGEAPAPPPPDPIGRMDFVRRRPIAQERLAALAREGVLSGENIATLRRWLDVSPSPEPAEPVLVHADLHTRNLLVAGGALSGVIDWVDLHAGHPALDLIAAYEILPPKARDVFFGAYGEVSAATLAAARFRAIDHAVGALAGALQRGDAPFARASRRALLEMFTE